MLAVFVAYVCFPDVSADGEKSEIEAAHSRHPRGLERPASQSDNGVMHVTEGAEKDNPDRRSIYTLD